MPSLRLTSEHAPRFVLLLLAIVAELMFVPLLAESPLGLHGTALCPLHRRLDAALASLEAAFAGVTLADILADPNPSKPLCELPGAARPDGPPGATVRVRRS